jgi:excinuclease ABC subunit A
LLPDWQKDYPKIQILSIAELLMGAEIKMPTAHGTFKQAQRIKLAKELARRTTGRTLYLLDEPTTGLHPADVACLLGLLQRLVDGGNTVVVIEHHMGVIGAADWIIDLGPEGGEAGGYVVAEGTPEEMARVAQSFTGMFLHRTLEGVAL